jgi:hypothetical protein
MIEGESEKIIVTALKCDELLAELVLPRLTTTIEWSN